MFKAEAAWEAKKQQNLILENMDKYLRRQAKRQSTQWFWSLSSDIFVKTNFWNATQRISSYSSTSFKVFHTKKPEVQNRIP